MSDEGARSCWTSDEQRKVAEFHRAMGGPIAGVPTMLTRERGDFRCRLVEEEVRELREATEAGNWLEMVDALVDIIYVSYGTAVELGVDLAPFFDEVHEANLRKIGASAGGKSIKPPGWKPPDLARVYRHLHGSQSVPRC